MATTYTVGTGKTYPTISAALGAIPTNLLGTGEHIVEVYAGGIAHPSGGSIYNEVVDAKAPFSNFNPSDRIILRAMVNHEGQRGKGIIVTNSPAPFSIRIGPFCEVFGFAVTHDPAVGFPLYGIYADHNIGISSMETLIHNNFVYDLEGDDMEAAGIYATSAYIYNNAIVNIRNSVGHAYGIQSVLGPGVLSGGVTVYNNTIYRVHGNDNAVGLYMEYQEGGCGSTSQNTIIGDCLGLSGVTATVFMAANGNYDNYYMVEDSADTGAYPGFNNLIFQNFLTQVKLTNLSVGAEDVRLLDNTSVCYDSGQDLSLSGFTDDFLGTLRPQDVAWDRGCHELITGPPPVEVTLTSDAEVVVVTPGIVSGKTTMLRSGAGEYSKKEINIPGLTTDGVAVITLAERDSMTDTRGQPEFWAKCETNKLTITCEERQLFQDTVIYYMVNKDGSEIGGGGGGETQKDWFYEVSNSNATFGYYPTRRIDDSSPENSEAATIFKLPNSFTGFTGILLGYIPGPGIADVDIHVCFTAPLQSVPRVQNSTGPTSLGGVAGTINGIDLSAYTTGALPGDLVSIHVAYLGPGDPTDIIGALVVYS